MQTYPSIGTIVANQHIFAFDKLDGSNIRAEWTRKSGFSKFGTRTRLLDPNERPLGEAIELFQEKYSDVLSELFRKERFDKATAFFEFHGPSSFAGIHAEEAHDVTLFDIHIYKRGLLPPREFLKLTKYVETAELLYEGKPTSEFIQKVRSGDLKRMAFEGVVCKGSLDNRGQVTAFKLKSEAWLTAVKAKYGHDKKLLEQLI